MSLSVFYSLLYSTDVLDNIRRWCKSWDFTFSKNKTVAMVFTTRHIPGGFQIFVGDKPLILITSTMIHGFTFDRYLTWGLQIE